MIITETRTPWINNLGDVPATLDYFQGSMYEAVEKIAQKYPEGQFSTPSTRKNRE